MNELPKRFPEYSIMYKTILKQIKKLEEENILKNNQIETQNKIIEWAEELGFDGVGFSDINLQEDEAYLLSWLKNKFHGEMHYMEKHGLKRSQPDKLMPGTVKVISFRMNYLQDNTVDSSSVLKNKNLMIR